jgi:hypothetical protein
MRFPRLSAGLVAVALTVGACGDSTGGGNTIELSETEAEALFEALDVVLGGLDFGASLSSPAIPAGLSLAVAGVPINESGSCPQGGSVSINGDVEEDGSSFDFTLGFSSCRSQNHTIGGNLDYTGSIGDESFQFDVNGTLNVTLPDARSGSCLFDVSISFSGTGGSVSGSICGQDISESASF